MGRIRRLLQVATVLLALHCAAALAQAPPYLVLRAAPGDPAAAADNPQIPVARQGYAYGWFGVPPRRHAAWHYGVRRQYIQWVWQ
jgi:hypothetical protein